MSDNISPGERRELRAVVRGQFKVLRAEVKRRKDEMEAEIEADLAKRYQAQDAAISDAHREWARARADYFRAVQEIGDRLQEQRPELKVEVTASYRGVQLNASDPNRAQVRRALIAAIPDRVGNANLSLDRQEVDLLRQLSEGALETDEARGFLGSIPTVGELVPRARLQEIESGLDGAS